MHGVEVEATMGIAVDFLRRFVDLIFFFLIQIDNILVIHDPQFRFQFSVLMLEIIIFFQQVVEAAFEFDAHALHLKMKIPKLRFAFNFNSIIHQWNHRKSATRPPIPRVVTPLMNDPGFRSHLLFEVISQERFL